MKPGIKNGKIQIAIEVRKRSQRVREHRDGERQRAREHGERTARPSSETELRDRAARPSVVKELQNFGQKNPNERSEWTEKSTENIHRVKSCEKPAMNAVATPISPPLV